MSFSLLLLGTLLVVLPAMSRGQIPDLPDREGFASPFAGPSHGVLLVAGGANIPGDKWATPFVKEWYSGIYALVRDEWIWGGQLPHRCAYGVSASWQDDVICCGGSDSAQHFADCCRLTWKGDTTAVTPLPPLPAPCANACGMIVNGVLYIAGGSATPQSTEAMHTFWALDLRNPEPKWEVLEPWPGPARILGVAGSDGSAFYLFSGADLYADKTGKAARKYLIDSYRYEPGQGWTRLPDMPRPAVAAPSPAPFVGGHRFVLIGGDDGANVHFEPVKEHPGFPTTCQSFDPAKKIWSVSGDGFSIATAPVVRWDGAWAVVNGEVRPRVRTPKVRTWQRPE